VVDLTANRTVAVDVGLAEAFRLDGGPGLVLPAGDRSAALVSAGAILAADLVLAVAEISEKDVRFLTASLYDIQRGRLQREGRVRLDGWTAPPGAIAALVEFVVSGVPSDLVIAKQADLSVAPPQAAPAPMAVSSGEKAASGAGKSKVKSWVGFSAGCAAIALGAFAAYEGLTASGLYDDAKGMLASDGTLAPGSSPSTYNSTISDADSAANMARVSGAAALGLAATSAVLGYLSYRESGEFGPIRF
jgi:hypothetical protein